MFVPLLNITIINSILLIITSLVQYKAKKCLLAIVSSSNYR